MNGQCAPATLPPWATAHNTYWTAPEMVYAPSRKPLRRSRVQCGPIHAGPMQQLSRPPPIQNLGAENHMLQLNI